MTKNAKNNKKNLEQNVTQAGAKNDSPTTQSNHSQSEQNDQTSAEESKKTTAETAKVVTKFALTGAESKEVVGYRLTASNGVWEFSNRHFAEKAQKDLGGEITPIYQ